MVIALYLFSERICCMFVWCHQEIRCGKNESILEFHLIYPHLVYSGADNKVLYIIKDIKAEKTAHKV